MATAPVSKTILTQIATDKNGTPIRVVTPDQDGNFQLKISKSDVTKVQIIDVDMVLVLADGTRLVLAGGALGALDGDVRVNFGNGPDTAARLLEQVGKIELQKFDHPQVLNSEPINRAAEEERNGPRVDETAHELASQAQAANATLAAISQALTQLATVVQNNAQPVNDFTSNLQGEVPKLPPIRYIADLPPERPGKAPQEYVIGPNEPAMDVRLVNKTTITIDGTTLLGSGGSSELNSSINPSNAAQIAPQIINASNAIEAIYANGKAASSSTTPSGTFSKVLDVQISGDGNVQSLVVSGVPNDMTIVGATSLGNNTYQINVSPGTKDYPLELEYNTREPNPGAPIHESFNLVFTLNVITTAGVQTVTSVRQVVVKDATTANDLTYANPVTGESVFVLPAQGLSHIVHAGNNAGVTMYGTNANDFLYGGTGNDTIYGGFGNNYFEGGAGNDTLYGNLSLDPNDPNTIKNTNTVGYKGSTAGVLVDFYLGSALDGFGGTDTLINMHSAIGSTHNDTFVVAANTKAIDGGSGGSDTIDFSASTAGVTVDLKAGSGSGGYAASVTFTHIDNVTGSSHNDTFLANGSANLFDGGSGGVNTVSYASSPGTGTVGVTVDLLTGQGAGGDAAGDRYINIQNVIGSVYDDVFVANAQANHFEGGGGNDTISYAGSAAGVTVDFYQGTGSGAGSNAVGDTYHNIQNVIGSAHDDFFVADTISKNFNGGSGGSDSVSYDRFLTSVTIDAQRNLGGLVTGTSGGLPTYSNSYINIDKFYGTAYMDLFIASDRADNFDGLGGVDTVMYAADTVGVVVNLVTGQGSGTGSLAEGDQLANIENVIGGSGNDLFYANDAANVFNGGAGSNTVDYSYSTTGGVIVDLFHGNGVGTSGGFAQGDQFINIQNVVGTAFDDTFVASLDANHFDGGTGGRNRVSYANDTVGVTVDLASGTGSGAGSLAQGDTFANIQDATGGSGNDTFIANNEVNRFDGGAGSDTVSYASSTDAVIVNLSGSAMHGVNSLRGSGGLAEGDEYTNIENVIGGSGDDTFYASADTSAAANRFDGGGGNHNRVSYEATAIGVTVDLVANTGSGGAAGDTYANIQDVTGGGGNDTFVASSVANRFDGGAGSDTVSYVNSNDAVIVNLSAGTLHGVDSMRGSGGFATDDEYTSVENVIGGVGDDTFYASADTSAAANRFDGSGGNHNRVSYEAATVGVTVNLVTNVGSDGAAGDTYANIQDVTGGSGNDTFVASDVTNRFDGGAGSDTVSYVNSTAAVIVNLSGGTLHGIDSMRGSGGFAIGDEYTSIENVVGGAGDDTFYASADTSAAANRFDGGGGNHNRVSYEAATLGVTVDLVANVGSGGAAGDTYANIQDVTGGSGNDTFVASAVVNRFDGGSGSDTVSYVNSTNAVIVNLSGGALHGVDSMRGSGGFADGDEYTSIENVIGGAGDDTFFASADTSAAANRFDGAAGNHNRVSYEAATVGVTVDLVANVGSGGAAGDTYANIQDVTGGSGNDTFVASSVANNFDGGAGINRVSYASSGTGVIVNLSTTTITTGGFAVAGGSGKNGYAEGDTYLNIQNVMGGGGNDTFIASDQANAFDGGGGSNTVHYGASNVGVIVNLSANIQDTLLTMQGNGGYAVGDTYNQIQNVIGSAHNDTFYGGVGANRFEGNGGRDLVSYAGDSADLTINLAAGTGLGGTAAGDVYVDIQDATGGSGNDTFVASSLANNFDGGGGNNTVSYAGSAAVVVNLSDSEVGGIAARSGSGNRAAGDTYTNIQNVIGGGGNDLFIASSVANIFTGGGGSDTVSYAASGNGVIVNLMAIGTYEGVAASRGSGGYAQSDQYNAINNVIGSDYNDVFVANNLVNTFDGGGGVNRVSYAASGTGVIVNLSTTTITTGGVTVLGGRGKNGHAEGDTYANVQNVTGSGSDDTFIASNLANEFNGGGGTNTVHYGASTAGVSVNLSANTQDTTLVSMRGSGGYAEGDVYTAIQNVVGSAHNDTFYGGVGANRFEGNGGRDRVSYVGETANLTINLSTSIGTGAGGTADGDTYVGIQDATGGFGNDTFVASSLANDFDGGAGDDTVSYASANNNVGVVVDLSIGQGAGGASSWSLGDTYQNIENVIGSTYVDTLIGATSGRTMLTGGAGGDVLTGIAANRANTYASYAGSSDGVTINLNFVDGTGTLGGDAAGDRLSFIDNLIGSSQDDVFIANAQANILDGGAGGSDTVSYVASTGGVRVNLSLVERAGITSRSGLDAYAQGDVYINIQNVIGSTYNDVLVGASAGRTELRGGAGEDTLIGIESNRVNTFASYVGSSAGVTIDLVTGTGSGGDAQGDTLQFINNLIGSSFNDTFIANEFVNILNGADGNNTVSYEASAAGVIVNLSSTEIGGVAGGTGSGGYAAGDTYTNIQNATGGLGNDTFIASSVANIFNGGGGNNTVSYAADGTAVTVDLFHNTGNGGFAQGDTYINIQNVIGTAGSDTFYAGNLASNFNGGGTDADHGVDTVNYRYATADFSANLANSASNTGYAAGDTYIRINNLTGSERADVTSTLTGDNAANVLTALGGYNNLFGGGGNDILDGRVGIKNTLTGGAGDDIYWAQVTVDKIENIDRIVGGDGSDTLKLFGLDAGGAAPIINMTEFLKVVGDSSASKVSGITQLDIRDAASTVLQFTAEDVIRMGVNNTLTVLMNSGDTLSFSGDIRSGNNAGNNYFSFYADATSTTELARINTLYA